MAGSQTAATLDVRMRMETGEFTAGATKAAQETTKLKNAITREMNAAKKEIQSLSYATEDYGKEVTKVAQLERELASGRYKNLQSSEQGKAVAAQLLAQAAAYDKVATATKAANKGLTEQQKIQLSYQLTDFVTQVGSGQNAMIAFLQQGGQFKDVMGGFGNTFKWLGTLFTPFRVAVGASAAALGVLAAAFYKGSSESAQFRDNLILTNNYAGLTEQALLNLAKASSDKLNVSIGGAKESLYALSASGKFTQTSIASVNEMVLRMSQLTGESADKVAEKLIPSLNGTASSAKSLNDKYRFLTIEQYKQIEALEKQGRAQEIIKLQTDAFNKNIDSQTRNLGYIERAWINVGNAISWAWNALKSFGKESLEQELSQVQKQIEDLHSSQADMAKAGGLRGLSPGQISEQFDLSLSKLNARAQAIQSRIDALKLRSKSAQDEAERIEAWRKAGGLSAQLRTEDAISNAVFDRRRQNLESWLESESKINELAAIDKEKLIQEIARKNRDENNQFEIQNRELFIQKFLAIEERRFQAVKTLQEKTQAAILENEYKAFEERLEAENEYQRKTALKSIELWRNIELEEKSLAFDREKLILQDKLAFASEAEKKSAEQRYELEKRIAKIKADPSINPQSKPYQIANLRQIQAQRDEFNKLEESIKRIGDKWDSVFSNMTSAIEQFVRTGKMSFKDLARSIISDLIMIEMKAQSRVLFGLLRNLFNPYSAGSGGGIDFSFLSGKASGGPVAANSPYIIGEKGPELFMPSGSGTIIPNDKIGGIGGSTNVTNYNIQAIDVKSFEERIFGSAGAVWAANNYAAKGMATASGRA